LARLYEVRISETISVGSSRSFKTMLKRILKEHSFQWE
jgi:hypothetical protein